MKTIFLISLLLPVYALAQSGNTAKVKPRAPLSNQSRPGPAGRDTVQEKAKLASKYPGGDNAMLADIMKNLVYPETRQKLTGKVLVNFKISPAGKISGAHVQKGLRADYDSAAVAAVRKLRNFETPGKYRENSNPVSFTVPVTFYKHQ